MLITIQDHLPQNQMAKLVCRPSDFLPVHLQLMLSDLDIATQLSRTGASRVKTIDSSTSLVTHNEGGDISMEIDCDNRDSAAGTHNA